MSGPTNASTRAGSGSPQPMVMLALVTLGFAVNFLGLGPVFSAPLGYLTRPYVVYRSRDDQLGSRAPRRGWEKVK